MSKFQTIKHNDVIYVNQKDIITQLQNARLTVYKTAVGRTLTEQEKGVALCLALVEEAFRNVHPG